jgi:hypothetical protein
MFTKVAAERRRRFTFTDPEAAYPSKEHVLGIGAEDVARGGHIRRSRRFGARSGSVGQGMNVSQRAQVEPGTEKEIPEDWGN